MEAGGEGVVGGVSGGGGAGVGGGGEVIRGGHGGGLRGQVVRGGGGRGTHRAAPLLLGLHPPVLEPDLDLSLGQPEAVGQLHAARSAPLLSSTRTLETAIIIIIIIIIITWRPPSGRGSAARSSPR